MKAWSRRLIRAFSFLIFPFALLFFALGCANRRAELLESELRRRESQQRESVEEITRLESRNEALWRELLSIRQGSPLPPEVGAQTSALKRITLGKLSGGYDVDSLPGDESLQVIVEPRDGHDHVIKAPGRIQIFVLEANAAGVKSPIGAWEFMEGQVPGYWKQGLLNVGYTFILPWKVPPRFESVRIAARLILADGRTFEVDRDTKVRLLPGAVSRQESVVGVPDSGGRGAVTPADAPGFGGACPPPANGISEPFFAPSPLKLPGVGPGTDSGTSALPTPANTDKVSSPVTPSGGPIFRPIPARPNGKQTEPGTAPIFGPSHQGPPPNSSSVLPTTHSLTTTEHRSVSRWVAESDWQAASLAGAATLGRPVAIPTEQSAQVFPATLSGLGIWR